MVAGQGQHHGRLDGGLTVEGDDAVGDAADGEDGGLRRIDDGVEGIHTVHAEVADGEAGALDVGRAQLAGLGAAHQVLAAGRELGEAQGVGAGGDGGDEGVVDGGGPAEIDVGVAYDRAVPPRS